MNWEHLYTNQRLNAGLNTFNNNNDSDARNSYQRDYDRIIFSGPFRRLQDKTQVFPLPGPVFVHNRLTHSLEVASVGRSLGQLVGEALCEKHDFTSTTNAFYTQDLSWVIAAACLAHDIGNPPFGHSGEDAIRAFFKSLPTPIEAVIKEHLTEAQIADLEKFEGNSMAFRLLAQKKSIYNSGFNLTLTTIASIVKYPSHSAEGFQENPLFIGQKKAGFFESEIEIFEQFAAIFQLPKIANKATVYARHPFVFLTEAADDICYRMIDMEDAHRLGLIDKDQIFNLFLPFFKINPNSKYQYENIVENLDKIKIAEQQIAYLRATWIGWMIERVTQIFLENENTLLEGNLNESLIDLMNDEELDLMNKINDYSINKIYNYPSSIEIELGGYTVLSAVLEELIMVILHPKDAKSKKISRLLHWDEYELQAKENHYDKIMFVIDFVVSATDSYVMDLYKKFKAISFTG